MTNETKIKELAKALEEELGLRVGWDVYWKEAGTGRTAYRVVVADSEDRVLEEYQINLDSAWGFYDVERVGSNVENLILRKLKEQKEKETKEK